MLSPARTRSPMLIPLCLLAAPAQLATPVTRLAVTTTAAATRSLEANQRHRTTERNEEMVETAFGFFCPGRGDLGGRSRCDQCGGDQEGDAEVEAAPLRWPPSLRMACSMLVDALIAPAADWATRPRTSPRRPSPPIQAASTLRPSRTASPVTLPSSDVWGVPWSWFGN